MGKSRSFLSLGSSFMVVAALSSTACFADGEEKKGEEKKVDAAVEEAKKPELVKEFVPGKIYKFVNPNKDWKVILDEKSGVPKGAIKLGDAIEITPDLYIEEHKEQVVPMETYKKVENAYRNKNIATVAVSILIGAGIMVLGMAFGAQF